MSNLLKSAWQWLGGERAPRPPEVREVAQRWERLPPGSSVGAVSTGPAIGSGSVELEPEVGEEQNPSQKPLGRQGPAPHDPYQRPTLDTKARRAVYLQEGDGALSSDFKQQVADLMQEEEYGVFRLVVPHVYLSRKQFNGYVDWLNAQHPATISALGKPAVVTHRSIFGLPMVPPFSPLSLFWMGLMFMVDIIWTAFGVPINVGFCSIDYGDLATNCTATDLAFGCIYALNLIFSFQLGLLVVNGHRKKKVMDGRKVAYYYGTHIRFWLDVAATVPFVYLITIIVLSDGQGFTAKWVNAISLIRLLRLLRLISVSQVIHIDSTLGQDGWISRWINVSTLYVLMVAYQVSVLVNFVACILILLAYMHGLEESWMSSPSDWEDLPNASRAYQWYSAIYWVITTATTTGYGDISPRWWAEQVVINATMIAGMIAFGILVAGVTTSLARADVAATRLQAHIKKISQVKEWLTKCTLNEHLRLSIQEYFAQIYVAKQSVEYGEAELFADLPSYLKFEVASELALPLIQRVHALRDLNEDAQQLLAAHFRPIKAIVGQELCRQGDDADRMWLLASGRLVALRHKEEPQHVTSPALVGDSLLLALDVKPCRFRPWTLRAASPCQLWEVRLEDLSRVIHIYPAIRLTLLEYVRAALVKHIFYMGADDQHGGAAGSATLSTSGGWCEVVALLASAVDGKYGELPWPLDDLSVLLERANIEDGSLQEVLTVLVEESMVRDGLTPEAVMGLPLGLQQEVQRQQADLAATFGQPPDLFGANTVVGHTIDENTSMSGPGPSPEGLGGLSGLGSLQHNDSTITSNLITPSRQSAGRREVAPWMAAAMSSNQKFHPHKGPAPWDMGDDPAGGPENSNNTMAAAAAAGGSATTGIATPPLPGSQRVSGAGDKVSDAQANGLASLAERPRSRNDRSFHGGRSPTRQHPQQPSQGLGSAGATPLTALQMSSRAHQPSPHVRSTGGGVGPSSSVLPMPPSTAAAPAGAGMGAGLMGMYERPIRRVVSQQRNLGAGSVESSSTGVQSSSVSMNVLPRPPPPPPSAGRSGTGTGTATPSLTPQQQLSQQQQQFRQFLQENSTQQQQQQQSGSRRLLHSKTDPSAGLESGPEAADLSFGGPHHAPGPAAASGDEHSRKSVDRTSAPPAMSGRVTGAAEPATAGTSELGADSDDPIAQETGARVPTGRRSTSMDGTSMPAPPRSSPLSTVRESTGPAQPDAAAGGDETPTLNYQNSQQHQHQHQQHYFRQSLTGGLSAAAHQAPESAGPLRPQRTHTGEEQALATTSTTAGGGLPPHHIAAGAPGLRRSMLSRFSSPFATAAFHNHHSVSGGTAVGAPVLVGAGSHATGNSGPEPAGPAGSGSNGAVVLHPWGQQPQPQHGAMVLGHPCTQCGAVACPTCGGWTNAAAVHQHPQAVQPHSHGHPQALQHRPPALGLVGGSSTLPVAPSIAHAPGGSSTGAAAAAALAGAGAPGSAQAALHHQSAEQQQRLLLHQFQGSRERATPSQSLMDAIRGSMRHRSGGAGSFASPPHVQPAALLGAMSVTAGMPPPAAAHRGGALGPGGSSANMAAAAAPGNIQGLNNSFLMAAGGGGAAAAVPGSPSRPLGRRSRMYGRSFAVANRYDNLMRNTLMRDTLMRDTIWAAYSQAEESDLASPSLPPAAQE
ncbi:hypothetical protein HYH02_001617 [Chlamydomonas schloesseri]|uniref:Cyclic nucleotide-binding domain-containing protein n=1 Tax=Chlamydomonas schloesseri TaxID=2026947 RepID=A0A835WU91_9CHLO|nr:hypothetical protein HYH02_001617 [Chlamydomonas schloesseri]|eukprot:KAG2453393.1 hypothetical protein HYH02_001617 [Chlamydomonas schloesseri]